MAKQFYVDRKFVPSSVQLIGQMNDIVENYISQGFRLTIRQLYYQLVTKNVVPNTEKSYKRVCSIANDARLAGVMDWDAIEDRMRAFVRRSRWNSAQEILDASASSFHMDMWKDQNWRVFVIVEKDALAGVLEGPCHKYDVPLLAARGYPSASVLREFAISDLLPALGYDSRFHRLDDAPKKGFKQKFMLLHLGDHDPSGLDMSRDLTNRLGLFCGMNDGLPNLFFRRIALNRDQVDENNLAPNPTKMTDARSAKYREEHGESSWELDAMEPTQLASLVEEHIEEFIEGQRSGVWARRKLQIEQIRKRISKVAEDFRE